MEMITISIPKNDYVQPTEVRQEVVQGICDAFLARNVWRYFHPQSGSNNGSRCPTLNIVRHKNYKKFYGFVNSRCANDWQGRDVAIRFNGAEMKAAFKALIDAGYHMYQVYVYGSWKAYICEKKQYYEGGREVFTFDDFID